MVRFYPIVRSFTSIAVCIFLLSATPDARAENVVGFEDAKGKTLFLHDFKGHPVLINLWATWCAPCVEEMPSLNKLQQDYAAKGLVVLTLSEDDTVETAVGFYKEKGLTSLLPYFDKGHAVWTALGARGVPTTVLVTRDGAMVQRIEGPVDWQSPQVKAIVEEITGK